MEFKCNIAREKPFKLSMKDNFNLQVCVFLHGEAISPQASFFFLQWEAISITTHYRLQGGIGWE